LRGATSRERDAHTPACYRWSMQDMKMQDMRVAEGLVRRSVRFTKRAVGGRLKLSALVGILASGGCGGKALQVGGDGGGESVGGGGGGSHASGESDSSTGSGLPVDASSRPQIGSAECIMANGTCVLCNDDMWHCGANYQDVPCSPSDVPGALCNPSSEPFCFGCGSDDLGTRLMCAVGRWQQSQTKQCLP
jgi:hypothetical protein